MELNGGSRVLDMCLVALVTFILAELAILIRKTKILPFRRLGNSRSGLATVLGTLIFVGIIFTCVIPLFLYVNTVNGYYEKRVTEMRQFDQEREMEELEVYAYPNDTNSALNVYIRNRCALQVEVMRVWINDTIYDETGLSDLPLVLSGVSDYDIQGIEISFGFYDVWVMTERGNLFASFTNTIHIKNETYWEPSAYNFAIHIFITKAGQYDITVTSDFGYIQHLEGVKAAPTAYRMIAVPKPGMYNVTVVGSSKTWHFDCGVSWTYPHAQVVVQ